MAWSWSHTTDAYIYARSELAGLTTPMLEEIAAEWRMHELHPGDSHVHAWADQWPRVLRNTCVRFKGERQKLIAHIWEKAQEQATCDNGGFHAWMCPYGCGPHCVDFGPTDEECEEFDLNVDCLKV